MRFLTDENISPIIVSALRKAGHNVLDIKEKEWYGKPDNELIRHACEETRIILTHDKDFIYQNQVPVILLRFFNQQPTIIEQYLIKFLNSYLVKKLKKPVVVILSEHKAEFHHS